MRAVDGTFAVRGTRSAIGCRSVRARLPAELLGTWPLSPAARRHLEGCLSCQALAARYRMVLRALRSLRDDLEEAPSWLVSHVLSSLSVSEPRRRSRAGTAVAVSAVAASVAVVSAAAVLRWMRSHAA